MNATLKERQVQRIKLVTSAPAFRSHGWKPIITIGVFDKPTVILSLTTYPTMSDNGCRVYDFNTWQEAIDYLIALDTKGGVRRVRT